MSATASHYFVQNVRRLYHLAVEQVLEGNVVRHGINWYTDHAPPAYITAVAAIEAFLNETALGLFTRTVFKDSALWDLEKDWVEKLELRAKLVIVPQLLFGTSFNRGAQPFQDMALLMKIRNEFVHYKMLTTAPRFVQELDQKGFALSRHDEHGADYMWLHKLCSSEGIRWANNTITKTAHALVAMVPEPQRSNLPILQLAENFREIDRDVAEEALRNAGQDPSV